MIDVARSTQPASLAAGKSYRERDVREALHATFLGKCYLCETPVEMGTFTVDHRKPRVGFPELEHVWENLFPTCSEFNCNGRREKSYPTGGLLSPGHGVEAKLIQAIESTVSISLRQRGSSAFVFRARNPLDAEAVNTATELDRLHNGTDSTAGDTANSLRNAIRDHVNTVADEVLHYKDLAASPTADATELAERRWRVERLVSRRAPYAMLVRSYFVRLDGIRALFD